MSITIELKILDSWVDLYLLFKNLKICQTQTLEMYFLNGDLVLLFCVKTECQGSDDNFMPSEEDSFFLPTKIV